MRRSHLFAAGALLVVWTAFVGWMFRREVHAERERTFAVALHHSRGLFYQIVDMRSWNADHGGVYVDADESTPPNPYLTHPKRDETTVSGRKLTMVNPAYMLRQIAEITRERRGTALHLTSLRPLRPQNAPDPWERGALEAFEGGARERAEFTTDEAGRALFRYMAPLGVETSCLECHAAQGYELGQIRGGISISFAAGRFERDLEGFRRRAGLALGALWLLGAALIAAVTAAFHQKLRLNRRLAELALEDPLTGLLNRRGFMEIGERQLQVSRRAGRPALVLFADLDGMKEINDRYGHHAGDAALRRAAGVLRAALRSSDIVSRHAGDEFVALCPDAGAEDAPGMLEAIRRRGAEANASAGGPWSVALSVGVAAGGPASPLGLEDLIRAADADMYRRKGAARPV